MGYKSEGPCGGRYCDLMQNRRGDRNLLTKEMATKQGSAGIFLSPRGSHVVASDCSIELTWMVMSAMTWQMYVDMAGGHLSLSFNF